MTRTAIAVDIGGTKVAAAWVDEYGTVSQKRLLPTPHTADILPAVAALCRELMTPEIVGIGVATAGQVDPATGIITHAVDTLPGWTGANIRAALAQEFSLPLAVENDVNALALAEQRFGAARGFDRVLCVAVGTGVGGALIANGQVEHGAHFSAGEVGHVLVDYRGGRACTCGLNGHLEAYASGPAIAADYAARVGVSQMIPLPEVVQRAHEGDVIAREVVQEGARVLGLCINGLLNVFDPQAVIVGGGVVEIGALWWEPFAAACQVGIMPAAHGLILRRAMLGVDAPLIGAGCLIL
jgi:glucokinase